MKRIKEKGTTIKANKCIKKFEEIKKKDAL